MGAVKILLLVCLSILVCPGARSATNLEKPISLQIESLSRWKNSYETPAIQQSLCAIINPRKVYPSIRVPFERELRYRSIFQRSFLLLDAEPNELGGFFALVVFKGYPKVLRLWVYEIDKQVFEIREAIPLEVTLNGRIMSELKNKKIATFWRSCIN